MNWQKTLLWLTVISFTGTALSTIPLLINYLRDVDPKFPLITHLHVIFGTIMMIVVIIRIIIKRKKLKAMMKID